MPGRARRLSDRAERWLFGTLLVPTIPAANALRFISRAAAIAALALLLGGCDTTREAPLAAERPKEVITRDVPQVLRNTIGAECTFRGLEPVLVSGYGVVVGLSGTGSRDVPLAIRSVLEREMTLQGVGQGVGALSDISPEDMISDPNNAVVLVRAVIKPGSPVGSKFDLLIESLPGTSTTSLEGGRLFTTKLFRGLVRPAMPVVKHLAEGRGELFINPFADPAADSDGTVIKTQGRVLNGGEVIEPIPLSLVLDNASHSRARAVAEAINSRFPRGSSKRPTARGVNDELVEISIPTEYADNTIDFMELLRHTRIDQQLPREWALRYTRALKEEPELANNLSWCLQALGPVAIPFVREMYAFPESVPRLAAIQAGARLGDSGARAHLEDLAMNGPPATRVDAFQLMGGLPPDPAVNRFLRDQLNSPEIDARIAAYEALVERADSFIDTRRVAGKFTMHIVPSSEPMVYATLQREPRIAVFGTNPQIERPVFVSAWSDRLMLSAQSSSDMINVFYRDYKTGRATTNPVRPGLPEFIEYMAHKPSPEEPQPGLNFSYSEIVGALFEVVRAGAVPGVFVPETDRLALEIIRSAQTEAGLDRPETAPEDVLDDMDTEAPTVPPPADSVGSRDRPEATPPAGSTPATEPTRPRRNYVVPLPSQPAAPEGTGTKKPSSGGAGSRDIP